MSLETPHSQANWDIQSPGSTAGDLIGWVEGRRTHHWAFLGCPWMGGADELGGGDGPGPSWSQSQAGYRGDSSVRVREPAGHGKQAPRRRCTTWSRCQPRRVRATEREAAGQAWPAEAATGMVLVWRRNWGFKCRNCQELQMRNRGTGQSRQSQERLQMLASRVAAPRVGQPSPPLPS